MTDISYSQPSRRSLRSRLILPGLFFVGGVGLAGWFVTSTETGRNLIAPPPPAIAIDPAKLAQPSIAAPAPDVAARIAELEARVARAEAAPGGALATGASDRATGLVLAFAARRAIERGQPLGAIEGELKSYFGESAPHLIAAVSSAAKQPVTLEQLRSGFEQITPALTEGGANWWSRLTGGVASLISVRDAADKPEDAKTIIARAKAAMDRGNVAAALAEMGRLPNAGATSEWMASARRYSEADKALAALEARAFEGRAVVAPVPLVPITPPAQVMSEPSI